MANLHVIGVSHHPHIPTAITECLTQITQSLSGRLPNYLLVFASLNFNPKELLDFLKTQSPQAQIIGITVSHLGLENTNPTLAIIGIHPDASHISIGIGNLISQNPSIATAQLTSQVFNSPENQPPTQLVLLCSQPTHLDNILNSLLTKFSSPIPTFVITAFGYQDSHPATVFFGNDTLPDGIIGLGIYGPPLLSATSYQTTIPVGIPQKITNQKGNLLLEINHLPAANLYEQLLPSHKLNRLTQSQFTNLTSAFPLCLFTAPQLTIVNPLGVTQEGGLILPLDIPTNCQLISLSAHDLTDLDNNISQNLTNLNNNGPTFTINTFNRHADTISEQAETDLIQKTIGANSLLTITTGSFILANQLPVNLSQHGRMIINLI